jgi:Ni/Co efflux regulator RcnB
MRPGGSRTPTDPIQQPGARVGRAPPLGGWNRAAQGQARVQLGQQWRSQNHNWDQRAPWRQDRNWWRSDPGFRLYAGARMGFFFFPGYGYVSSPQQYTDHDWQAGEYLPNWFWRYTVNGYDQYGLPTPPDGCAWVWLNGSVVLIDLSDGYIVDIVPNLW